MKVFSRPDKSEYAPYYDGYISLVTNDPISTLAQGSNDLINLLSRLTEEQLNFAYADGKWTIKEVIGHVIDSEIVFMYRAVTIARQDKTALPGFEQNDWVEASNYKNLSKSTLINLFRVTREYTLTMLETLDENMLSLKGIANENPITVNALMYILAGHHLHHQQIIEYKYLTAL